MSNLLIVDDDMQVSDQIERMLRDTGAVCTPLLEPKRLFENLNYETPDLILLDIVMPGINGVAVLRKLKNHQKYKDIPVIMITANTEKILLAECFEIGAMDFLNKPIDPYELRARIASVMCIRDYQLSLEKEIRERKQLQSQLIQAAKLAALGKMGTGVAHEMNTPLAIIKLSVEQLREDLEDGELSEVPEVLKRIDKQVDRTAEVTGYLRNFAGDMGQGGTRTFSPEKLVADVSLLLSERLKTDNIKWQIEMAENLPLLNGIPLLLQQVLFSLISNAQDAVKNSPEKRIILRIFSEDKFVILEVEDTGTGIPEDIIPCIFDPFFTTKPVGSGQGLGLSAGYGIMGEHKGHLRLKQTSDSGSTFQLSLPVEEDIPDED